VPKEDLSDEQAGQLGELHRVASLARAVEEDFEGRIRKMILGVRYPGGGDPTDRVPQGVSWAAIGESLGVSGEAARKRYGPWVMRRYQSMLREWAESVGLDAERIVADAGDGGTE